MDGNEMAYPAWEMGGQGPEPTSFGLTKRELFAAMAMQGILSGRALGFNDVDVARQSMRCADALIAKLKQTETRPSQ